MGGYPAQGFADSFQSAHTVYLLSKSCTLPYLISAMRTLRALSPMSSFSKYAQVRHWFVKVVYNDKYSTEMWQFYYTAGDELHL